MTLDTYKQKIMELYKPLDCEVSIIINNREEESDYLPGDLQLLIIRSIGKDWTEEIEVVYTDDVEFEIQSLLVWELNTTVELNFKNNSEPNLKNYSLDPRQVESVEFKPKHELKQ